MLRGRKALSLDLKSCQPLRAGQQLSHLSPFDGTWEPPDAFVLATLTVQVWLVTLTRLESSGKEPQLTKYLHHIGGHFMTSD